MKIFRFLLVIFCIAQGLESLAFQNNQIDSLKQIGTTDIEEETLSLGVGRDRLLDKDEEFPEPRELRKATILSAKSSRSKWIGASVQYNFFDENDLSNLISTAKVKMGTFDLKNTPRVFMDLTGNISGILSSNDAGQTEQNLAELVRENQGFQIGLQPGYFLWAGDDEKQPSHFLINASFNFKFNAFKISDNPDDDPVRFQQFRFTLGFEYENWYLIDGQRPINISGHYFSNSFSKSKYEQVFGNPIGKVAGFETTLIIPIGGTFGFQASIVNSSSFKPIWSAGVIIASSN